MLTMIPRPDEDAKMTRLKTLVVALLAGLVLVGCASPPGSVAVQVGDQRVDVTTVDDTYALLAQHPEVGRVSRQSIAATFVVIATLEQIAKDRNIPVSSAEVQSVLGRDRLFLEVRKDPLGDRFATKLARNTVITSKLGVDWRTEVGKYDVQLNPRYGTWNSQQLQVDGYGHLASPIGRQ